MGHRDVERLRRLAQQRAAVVVDGAGDDHRQADLVLLEVALDGDQARLEDENVVAGFHGQQIDASPDERVDLGVIGIDEVIERQRAAVQRLVTGLDVKRFVGRPDAAGDEARPVGVAARVVLGGATGQLGGGTIDLADVLDQPELAQGQRRGVERAGLNHVGAGVEVGAVNLVDQLRLG
jgi:hypothetical protein